MKKEWMFFLNITTIVPYLLVCAGITSFESVMIYALINSIINLCFVNSVRCLMVYNVVLYVCATTSILPDYLNRKKTEVGFHPEVMEEYQLLAIFVSVFFLFAIITELCIKYFLKRRK